MAQVLDTGEDGRSHGAMRSREAAHLAARSGQLIGAVGSGTVLAVDRLPPQAPPLRRLEASVPSGVNPDLITLTQILIVDDCTLQRENLAAILGGGGMSALAVAWDLPSTVAALAERAPDIVLLSMQTRDKIALLHSVREICPSARVIVVGISEDDESDIIASAEAGVAGYHLRSESLGELLNVITKVVDGEPACSPRVSAILLRRLSAMASARRSSPRDLDLTARELQILQMLELGLSNRDIADQLCITLHTVKNHVHSVLTKLGVSTRAQAAAFARTLS
ncbi:LuxR C-terminal-related transcriptional regulator [Mycolicibacterium sp.]|uniref:LuxR C-terminal-related transcriptional regulator n=1 Tax=Mycolicibacterium sp. TaxID=2320850 RepID=UPI003D147631